MLDESTTQMLIRVAGSVSGSIFALVYEPPRSRLGLYRRLVVSLPAGIIFADWTRETLHMAETWMNLCASATIAAGLAWFAIGAGIRVTKAWKGEDKPKG